MPESTHTVAIFNASDDTVEMIKAVLAERGYRVVNETTDHVKSGALDFVRLIEARKPDAIVWDIAPPYERNWNFFKLLRTSDILKRCLLVLTTTNKQHLNNLAGQETGAIEIVGETYDIQSVADAVTRGLEPRVSPDVRQFKARE